MAHVDDFVPAQPEKKSVRKIYTILWDTYRAVKRGHRNGIFCFISEPRRAVGVGELRTSNRSRVLVRQCHSGIDLWGKFGREEGSSRVFVSVQRYCHGEALSYWPSRRHTEPANIREYFRINWTTSIYPLVGNRNRLSE